MEGPVEYIDLTPTWEQVTPALIYILLGCSSTDKEQRKTAEDELLRMAKLADLYVASQKKVQP